MSTSRFELDVAAPQRLLRAALVTLATAFACPAQAQGFDFTRQDINIDLTGAAPTIELDLTVTATRDTSSFDFLIPPATLESFDVGGASIVPTPHPQAPQYIYHATFPTELKAGDTTHIHARLSGAMSCTASVQGRPPACFSGTSGTLLISATYEAAWYFVNVYEEVDPFDSAISVRAPAAQTVITGQGAGTAMDLGDGTKRWSYALSAPLDMIFLAAGDYASVEAAGPYTVKAFWPRGRDFTEGEQHAVDLAAKVLPIYARLYGDLPVREAHLITAPANFPAAGMGFLANVFLSEYIFGDYGYLLEQGIAHEFAHSWWGNLARSSGDERGLMGEALAEYSAWRALGEVQGDAVRTSGMRMNAVWYMYRTPPGQDVPPVSTDVDRQPGYVFVTYHKGPLAFRAMEEVAGVDAFTKGLAALITAPQGEATLDRLVTEVKNAGGADLAPEVAQWMKQTGFPKLAITATAEAGTVKWKLESTGLFNYRLPVRLRFAGGRTVDQVLQVQPGTATISLSLDGELESIEADPRWTLPREVKPALAADVTLDGVVDGRDLLEVAVRVGGGLPEQRRVDGHYDPLFDVDSNFKHDVTDMTAVVIAAGQ